MALVRGRPVTARRRGWRGTLGVRFVRFAGAAIAALTATEIALTVCNGVFHLTATKAALISWFAGAVVSYGLSRWAWNRTGRPDVLRETLPFWLISVLVVAFLTLANKFGYQSATWFHLTGAKHVLWVDLIWLLANSGTFLLRFLIFHYVLFTAPRSTKPLAFQAVAAARARAALRGSKLGVLRGHLLGRERDARQPGMGAGVEDRPEHVRHFVARVIGKRPVDRHVAERAVAGLPGNEGKQ